MRRIQLGSRPVKVCGTSLNRGASSPQVVIIILLSAILLALFVLVVIVLMPGNGEPAGEPPLEASPAPELKPINEPERIKETLQSGKTYRTVLKFGLDARAEDKDWGVKSTVSTLYAAEMVVDRTVESNNGVRIVERRHFDKARSVKLLTEVEDVSIELGLVGTVVLGALDYIEPGVGATILSAKPIAETILAAGANEVARSEATKAFAHVDSLSGKTVQITYVDGVGIESVLPVDCMLSDSEMDFVKASAVVSDYYMMPQLDIKVGGHWSVSGGQFGGFIDPSLRGVPSGEIVVGRDSNHSERGKEYATLRIQRGYLEINESDDRTQRVGTFTPSGTLKYCITDRIVESADFKGRMVVEKVSKDHLFFESRFKATPNVTVIYSCEIN